MEKRQRFQLQECPIMCGSSGTALRFDPKPLNISLDKDRVAQSNIADIEQGHVLLSLKRLPCIITMRERIILQCDSVSGQLKQCSKMNTDWTTVMATHKPRRPH